MAEQEDSLKSSLAAPFKSIQLLKESSLGSGGYGAVCKVQCDELVCAAKTLNFLAFSEKNEAFGKVLQQECDLLKVLCHPNVIQYLGTWTDLSPTSLCC